MAETVKVELGLGNLDMLSAFAPTDEMKARLSKSLTMLKEKARENWGIEIDSNEYKDMIRMRTWVSSDPVMAEKIGQANQITSQVINMQVVEEFTREEIETIIKGIEGKYFPNNELLIMQGALKKLDEAKAT